MNDIIGRFLGTRSTYGLSDKGAKHPATNIELVELGASDQRFVNVLAPASREAAVGLTAQFTDNAAVYANAYASSPYFIYLINRAVALSGLSKPPKQILDIGAGAGDNSTFPAAEIWPDALITATDLSPQLLAILIREAKQRGISDKIRVICVDAMKDIFQKRSFDVVIGSAILHHLIEPLDALRAAHRVLRPGGVAIFFEPFELGYVLVAKIFDRIEVESSLREDPISDIVSLFFRSFVSDVKRRLGEDKSAPLYREIDDKWLFTKRYFEDAAMTVGFSMAIVDGIHAPEGHLSGLIKTFLRIGTQSSIKDLPPWAQHYCLTADEMFVGSSKDILSEAIVVMKK